MDFAVSKKTLFLLSLVLLLLTACQYNPQYTPDDQSNTAALSSTIQELKTTKPLKTYSSTSPFANDLQSCQLPNTIENLCSLNKLPFIGSNTDIPTVQEIMNRVTATEPWMGKRFEQLLNMVADSPALLKLFKAVTGIAISTDFQPAFFHSFTANIYFDPKVLWVTETEMKSVNTKFYSELVKDSDVSFAVASRIVQGNTKLLLSTAERLELYNTKGEDFVLSQMLYPFAQLLFHELAHANDFYPPSVVTTLDTTKTLADYQNTIPRDPTTNLNAATLSYNLHKKHPITTTASNDLFDLSSVLFRGKTATSYQQTITGTTASNQFKKDTSNHLYSYVSSYEDLAMIFEAAILKAYFSVDVDFAFLNSPGTNYCRDLKVIWGSRNRIANPLLHEKANYILTSLFNDYSWEDLFSKTTKEQELEMTPGIDWCNNIIITPPLSALGNTYQGSIFTYSDYYVPLQVHSEPRGHVLE